MGAGTRGLRWVFMASLGEQKIILPPMNCSNKTNLKLTWIDMYKNYYINKKNLAALNL